jgi:hypothetical protein
MFIGITEEDGTRWVNVGSLTEVKVVDNSIVLFHSDDGLETLNFKSTEIAEEVAEDIVTQATNCYRIDEEDLADE